MTIVCPEGTLDSNATGLRIAIERCLKELPSAAAPVAASGTITLGSAGVDGDTFTVGATVLTLVAAAPGAGEVLIGASASDTATNLAAAIDALAPVTAAAVGPVITVTAATAGEAGNSIALATTGDATLSGALLRNGADQVYDPEWVALEPNSYSDFGGSVSTVARNPINPSRQRRKGTVTDLEASGGFNQDVTLNNMPMLMQGVVLAAARELPTTRVLDPQIPDYATSFPSGTTLRVVGGASSAWATFFAALPAGVKARIAFFRANGSTVVHTANSGAASGADYDVTLATAYDGLSTLVEARVVGIVLPTLQMATPVMDFGGAMGAFASFLSPGSWVFIDHPTVSERGFARIGELTANTAVFDKTTFNPTNVSGSNVAVYMGTVIRNESDPALIRKFSYQLERTLGQDNDGMMSEYIIGATLNEFTLNVPQAAKVTADFAFIACDAQPRTGLDGLKAGTRPTLVPADAFNTSSDFSRIKLALVDEAGTPASAKPLFAFVTDMSITANNNASANKAVGYLGAIGVSLGTFEVGGEVTAYFANNEAVQAVRNNSDVTLDFIMVKKNVGIVVDIPLLSLGNGRLNVEQDQPITLPLELNAAENKFGYTFLFQQFPYLPATADL
jgi:hypothetical protein